MSKIYSEVIRRAKEIVKIESLLSEDGVELTSRGSNSLVGYHKNKHESSSGTSLNVNPERGLYYCFNCCEGGDHITWLRKNRYMNFMEALKYLTGKAKIEMPSVDPEEHRKYLELRDKRERYFNLFTKVAELYHSQLSTEDYELLNEKWGLNKETVDRYKIGYAPVEEHFLFDNLKQFNNDEGLITSSGLINRGGYDFFQGRLIFPYWKNDMVVYFIGRETSKTPDFEWEKAKYKKLLTHSSNNLHVSEVIRNNYFIGENSLWGANEVTIITEGVTDCYSAIQNGFSSISPATISFRANDYQRLQSLLKSINRVFICNDSEVNQSGEKGAYKIAEYLDLHGIEARIIKLTLMSGQNKMDLAEYLRDHSKEDFQELIREAKTIIELYFSDLESEPSDKGLRDKILNKIAKNASEIDREMHIKKFKTITGIGVKAIRSDVHKIRNDLEIGEDDQDESISQADQLILLAKDNAYLFHDEIQTGYASFKINKHWEAWALESEVFKSWLIKQFYDLTEKSPNNEAIRQAVGTLKAIAVFDGEEHELSLRVAENEKAFWYDLANSSWQAVKVTSDGWDIVDKPPIIFRRYVNTAPQITPVKSQDSHLNLLKKYFNLKNEEDYVLLYAFVANIFIPNIPHPTIILYGDKGSAKTTAQKVIRMLCDPAHLETVFFPRDSGELSLQLMTNYVPCFDNLDGLKDYQSDMLCQAVTGGGTTKRKLYTDTDEIIVKFKRCIMLNGINLVATRDDLLDRSIILRLDRISQEDRKEEADFWREFEEDRPLILGEIFNIISMAMSIHPTLKLKNLPRMADFTRWGYAITEAMGLKGETFLQLYLKNISEATEEAVLENMVSSAILDFMEIHEEWKGTATVLLEELSDLSSINETNKNWPKLPQSLSREINKMSSALADQGIIINRYRDGNNKYIELSRRC